MYKKLLNQTFLLATLTLALIFNGGFNKQAQAASLEFFKFLFNFESGASLKGFVKGELEPTNNTVSNLSNLFAVYSSPVDTPIVFNTLDLNFNPNPQFTLNGDPLLSFGGVNSNGDSFDFQNTVNSGTANVFEGSILKDSFSSDTAFPFQAEDIIYPIQIKGDLTKDTTIVPGVNFPDEASINGFLLFDNNVDSLKQNNTDFLPLTATDYPFSDFFVVFSDENGDPNYVLLPDGSPSTFTAINPNQTRGTGKTNPMNPSTFEFLLQWDVGYTDNTNTNEVLKTGAGQNLFLPVLQGEQSRLVFFDSSQNEEAIYQVTTGSLHIPTSPEPSNLLALVGILGLSFWLKKQS